MKPDCYQCIHRRNLAGDAHSECAHPKPRTLTIVADNHGIRMGWFLWPLNFDPVWLEACNGFTPKAENTNGK